MAGVPMTCGTQPFHLCKDKPAPIPIIDAPIVSRVLEAGAVITGTSTCENYCLSAMSFTSATGPVDNPWLKGHSAGGSSSGSAVLIAVNMMKKWRESRGLATEHLGEGVDLATGGDQGGSIRVVRLPFLCSVHPYPSSIPESRPRTNSPKSLRHTAAYTVSSQPTV